MEIDVTVVSGTYNRLPHLQRMVESARISAPGLRLDFVLVDGGSTDGTQAWCKTQPDVTLLDQGVLLGAIRAFCDGANLATGRYVVLANDDIEFLEESILAAFVYLETHPSCGAVAFADNRPGPHKQPGDYGVDTMRAIYPGDYAGSVPYAQVGLFRRWLGEQVGWWGADDPGFGGHTYGGDNYLSARIWEAGFTVDPVPLARVNDRIVRDDLRRDNQSMEYQHPARYFKRYPNGPLLPGQLERDNTMKEQLRILYLPVYERGNTTQKKNKKGLRDALRKYGIVYELDYVNKPVDLPGAVEYYQPHLILTQLHAANEFKREDLERVKKVAPHAYLINWNGDARGLTDPGYMDLLSAVDLQLVVNAAALPEYMRKGIPAAYWQIGYEDTRGEILPLVQEHDVVFLGNNYNESRRMLESTLSTSNVAFYGSGWRRSAGSTLYDFAASRAIHEKAKIVIGDVFNDEQTAVRAFVSNRLIQTLGDGGFLLQEKIKDFELFNPGLIPGVHYAEWRDRAGLREAIEYWLAHPEERAKIAKSGADVVRRLYSFDSQVFKLMRVLIPRFLKRVDVLAP